MAFYSNSISPAAPGTANDILTFTAAAVRVALIHEVSISGEGSASAANELGVTRATTVGVTPTAQTSAKVNPLSATPGFTCATAWTTQPVLAAVPLLRLGANSNGGVYRWVAKPGEEFLMYDVVTTGQISLRMTLGGAQQMGVHAIIEDF
jgi:hypothetical protein